MILRNLEIFGNKMEYIVDRDYGTGILNTGVVYSINCTFHDNKAKYGGAIYNQGLLILTNSSFYSNNGYSKGKDIVNVDKGVVSIDGETFEACGGKNIVYIESLSSDWQTAIKITCYAGSFILGAVAGFFTANPLIAMAVGAAIGSAVGGVGSAVICSNVYDINFCRWSCALTLVLGSAGAGAAGGGIGSLIRYYVTYSAAQAQIQAASQATASSSAATDTLPEATFEEAVNLNNQLAQQQNTFLSMNTAQQQIEGLRAAVSQTFRTCKLALIDAKVALHTLILSSAKAVMISTIATTLISYGLVAAGTTVPGAILSSTVVYVDSDDVDRLLPADSNSILVASDLIHSIKFDKDGDIQVVKAFINLTKSFSEDEVLDAISSIDLKREGLDSILY